MQPLDKMNQYLISVLYNTYLLPTRQVTNTSETSQRGKIPLVPLVLAKVLFPIMKA